MITDMGIATPVEIDLHCIDLIPDIIGRGLPLRQLTEGQPESVKAPVGEGHAGVLQAELVFIFLQSSGIQVLTRNRIPVVRGLFLKIVEE